MSKQIAERDARIVQLERDLAVEKAKLAQVVDWVKQNSTASSATRVRETSSEGADG